MKTQLNKRIVERLIILGEENNELAQVVCKIQRFGLDAKNQGKLIQEIGDVIAMIGVVVEELDISEHDIKVAVDRKLEKIKRFTFY